MSAGGPGAAASPPACRLFPGRDGVSRRLTRTGAFCGFRVRAINAVPRIQAPAIWEELVAGYGLEAQFWNSC